MEHQLILLPYHLSQFQSLAPWEEQRRLHPGMVLLLSVFVRETNHQPKTPRQTMLENGQSCVSKKAQRLAPGKHLGTLNGMSCLSPSTSHLAIKRLPRILQGVAKLLLCGALCHLLLIDLLDPGL